MTSPALETIKAARKLLGAEADLVAAFGERIAFGWIAPGAKLPAITLTTAAATDAPAHCYDIRDFRLHLNIWARDGAGAPDAAVFAEEWAEKIGRLLNGQTLALDGWTAQPLARRESRLITEPQNNIARVLVTFGAYLYRGV